MRQRRHFQKSQFGQGMVEYAILLILTVTLVIGGIELASATLASGKASDAAKAGASDLAAINETRLKAQANQQKYLRQLELLLIDPVSKEYRVSVDSGIDITEADIINYVEYPVAQVFLSQSATAEGYEFDNYVQFLDYFRDKAIRDLGEASINAEDIIDAYMPFFDDDEDNLLYLANLYISEGTSVPEDPYFYEDLADIIEKIDGITDDDDDGIVDEDDKDGEITVNEVIHAIKFDTQIDLDNDGDTDESFNLIKAVQNLNPTFEDETGTMSEAAVVATQTAYKIIRLRALVLFEEIQLASLPLDPRVSLSESTPLIGDHIPDYAANTSDFTRPACNSDGSYTNGFPDVDDDGVTDTALELVDTGDTINVPAVYLFNPLPVDAVSCQGNDAARGGRSRMSILIGGHGKEGDENYFSGLPKLNQAFYGQYTRVCLNNANEYVACGKGNVAQELLKPPGKLCLSTVATAGVDSCPGLGDDHIETSGYYFWGYPSGEDKFKWIYDSPDAPVFRPTMQITCNDQTVDTDDDDVREFISSESCDPTLSQEPLKTVRINVRYRSVFESFLTFGLMELTNPNGIANLADYFYDPSNLRALGNGGIGVPVAGSELGPKSATKNPTVKNFKDFRGCFDINIETNQVTSCN